MSKDSLGISQPRWQLVSLKDVDGSWEIDELASLKDLKVASLGLGSNLTVQPVKSLLYSKFML